MHITNNANLPAAIVRAVVNDPYDAGACDISVTRLIGPPQIRVLEREHAEELTEDASDRIWSLIGQIGHGILERAEVLANAGAIAERRLFADIAGWRISGQFDRMTIDDDGTLSDYKFTSVWAVADGAKPEWEAQLNILRWLAERNGYPPIRRLLLVAILRDWSRGQGAPRRRLPAASGAGPAGPAVAAGADRALHHRARPAAQARRRMRRQRRPAARVHAGRALGQADRLRGAQAGAQVGRQAA